MARLNDLNHLTDVYLECLIPVDNLRVSILRPHPNFPEPNLKAIVLEYIKVEEKHRRKGIARRCIERLRDRSGFDIAVVQGVQDRHLAHALLRWGWACDRLTMDFYWPKSDAAKVAVEKMLAT